MAPIIAVIPVRMGSTRFPGKALASDTGRPLVLHVADAVGRADRVDRIIVASEDREIEAVCAAAGVEHAMTASTHRNGSSRMAEVAQGLDGDIFLNVQGDEPEIDPATLDATIDALRETPEAGVATAATRLDGDLANPNVVKVVTALDGTALYFSRSVIPYGGESSLRHVGIYAFRPEVLARYPTLAPTPLEAAEGLEQLRLLEHGVRIAVATVPTGHGGIDTPEQYAAFVARWRAEHPD